MLSLKHKREAHKKQIFLNIFQPAHDRKLASIARRLRTEGLIADTFVKPNGFTIVVANDSMEKVRIYDDKDLEAFAHGRNLDEFDISTTSLKEA